MIRSSLSRCAPSRWQSIRDAAGPLYDAAVRTPLVRLDLPFASPRRRPEVYLKLESLQPIGSFKLRGAWNAVRRLPPEALQDGVWTVSAGNAAQGVAFAARRRRRAVLGDGDGHRARDQDQGHRAARRHHRPRHLRRGWRTVESHRSDRMRGHFVHPFDDDDFIAGNATAGLEILEDLPDVDAVVASLGGGGLLAGIGSGDAQRSSPACGCSPPSPRPRRRWPPRWRAARPATSTAGRRRSSTAPAASRCCRRCGRCCSPWSTSRLSCRSTTWRRRCATRPSASTSSPRAPPGAPSPRRSAGAPAAARSWPSSPAATSTCRVSPNWSARPSRGALIVRHLTSFPSGTHRYSCPCPKNDSPPPPRFPAASTACTSSPIDLWWSWDARARDVFRRLDYALWRSSAHNPVKMLQQHHRGAPAAGGG